MAANAYIGDAVISYGAFKRASAVFAPGASLVSVTSLFSVIEATVLYEHLWYLPFGDEGNASVSNLAAWGALAAEGLVRPLDATVFGAGTRLWGEAQEGWKRQVFDIGHIPTYAHVSRSELLANTFQHALHASAWAYDSTNDEHEVFTAEGLERWKDHVTGAGFDQRAEDANDGDDDGRFMNWERTVVFLARASVVRTLGADCVGDAFEDPVIQLNDAFASRAAAARLYAKVSANFKSKVAQLQDDRYAAALPIPPIVAILLDRCDGRLESIVRELVALRAEFAPFRARYRAYADTLANPAGMTVGDLIEAKREAFDEVGAALNKVDPQRSDSRLLSEVVGASLKPGEDGSDSFLEVKPSVSLASLVRLGVERYKLWRIKARAQNLFDVYGKALRIKNLHSLIGKRLAVNISPQDYRDYRAYAKTVEGLAKVDRRTSM